MKKQKIEKRFAYEGLGFPVVLLNVPMAEIRGVWTPKINYEILQKKVLLALAHFPALLTGNQIRFIRSWLGLTLSKFGKNFGVTHAAVKKWEQSKDNSAKLGLSTQREIRLFILSQLLHKGDDFLSAYRNLIARNFEPAKKPLEVDTQLDLVAI